MKKRLRVLYRWYKILSILKWVCIILACIAFVKLFGLIGRADYYEALHQDDGITMAQYFLSVTEFGVLTGLAFLVGYIKEVIIEDIKATRRTIQERRTRRRQS